MTEKKKTSKAQLDASNRWNEANTILLKDPWHAVTAE